MRLRSFALALLAAGCGGGGSTPPPPPSPPVVQVIPQASFIVDSHFSVAVTVSGCDTVKSVQLADGARLIATAPAPDLRNTFDVGRSQIDYKADGILAHLDLLATAECANGTSATSQGVAVSFMPADQDFPGTFPLNQLTLDTSGQGLFACQGTALARYDLNGTALQTTGSDFKLTCTDQGYGLRAGPNEIYWVEPGYGVARIDPSSSGGTLKTLSSTSWVPGPSYFPPGGANPAVFFNSDGSQMLWLDRTTGQVIASGVGMDGPLDGDPGFGSAGLFLPEAKEDLSMSNVNLDVEEFNVSTATSIRVVTLASTAVGALGTANVPALNLSASGGVGYFVAGDTHQDIYACDTGTGCASGASDNWKITLPGGPWAVAEPVGNYLSVRGGAQLQFLDTSGTPVGGAVAATSGLSVQGIYPGKGTQLFALDVNPNGETVEMVMLNAPGVEAARLTLATGALAWDIDGNGQPWVINGSRLARLLTPDQYLAARQ